MNANRLASSILLISVFAGCSQAPAYKIPVVPAPAAYKGDAAIWQPSQPSDNLPRGDWWKAYKTPALDDLVVRLDAANADLAVAVAHFDQATAYAAQARAGYFPTVSAGAYSTRNRQSQNRALRSAAQPNVYGDNALGVMADYEVDLWGRVRNQVEAGEAGAQAAAAELESIHLSLRAELVNNYLTLRMLDAQSKLLADEVGAYTKALELTQNRFQGGIDSALDVSRAKVQLETAQAKIADLAASRALYEHAIATLVGQSASKFSIAPAVVDIPLPAIPVGVPAALLQRRPDIAAAERHLAEANARIGVAKSAFFPTVNLSAAAGYESTYQSAWLTAPNLFWMIGPNALMTIFDAGRREAVVAQEEAVFRESGAKYRSAVLHAFQEVEDNLSLLSNLTEESSALDAAVRDTQNTLDIAMNRYREGAASYLEVVTAQATAQQVQLDALDLRRRRLQASVNLVRALGGGWEAARIASR
ncbi:outer membrane protein OprM precursor [mine drainage metagenome]|uniref:Outer membrane protein OprM n=1 Tax=mine drainage metagenome TaxID=410659 RepID=A0A1J5RUB8_9ZZZZ